jgi:hypothetical protein
MLISIITRGKSLFRGGLSSRMQFSLLLVPRDYRLLANDKHFPNEAFMLKGVTLTMQLKHERKNWVLFC